MRLARFRHGSLSAGSMPDSQLEASGTRIRATISILLLVLVAWYAAAVMHRSIDPAHTDVLADWLVVSAAVDGLDPWQDLRQLAAAYGVPFGISGGGELDPGAARIHPRTPGALLLMRPLAEVSAGSVVPVALAAASLALLAAIGVSASGGWSGRMDLSILWWILCISSAAYLSTMQFGSHSAILMLCIAVVWSRGLESSESHVAGVAIGIAGTLRIFPLLLLVPLWEQGRRRTCVAAGVTFMSLNMVGLGFFDLAVSDAISALAVAGGEWMGFSGNGSLAMPLVRAGVPGWVVGPFLAIAAVVAAAALPTRDRDPRATLALVLLISILCSPLAWEHYDLVLWVVLGHAVISGHPRTSKPVLVLVVCWVCLQLFSYPLEALFAEPSFNPVGSLALVGRLVLLPGFWLLWRGGHLPDSRPRSRSATSSRPREPLCVPADLVLPGQARSQPFFETRGRGGAPP